MLTAAKKEFIEFMMSADVLRFGDFTTKSGRKTPYFVNTGNYKTGLQNSRLGEFYAALVKETVGDQFDAMFGPAYKASRLLPRFPVRWLAITASTSRSSSTARRPRIMRRRQYRRLQAAGRRPRYHHRGRNHRRHRYP